VEIIEGKTLFRPNEFIPEKGEINSNNIIEGERPILTETVSKT